MSSYKSNFYIDPLMNIIVPSSHVLDVGVYMASHCTFDFHIFNLYKQCSNLAGWILRTFTMGDPQVVPPCINHWSCPDLITHPSFGNLIY